MQTQVAAEKKQVSVLDKAAQSAFRGGTSGAIAMVAQVGTLMWLRTTMNYQYRYGTTTGQALKTLYSEGGVFRFYRGVGPALIQAPLSRFGDTAANAGMLVLLDGYDSTKNLGTTIKTGCASVAAASMRIALMPVDTVKTIMQVEGKQGIPTLMSKMKVNGPKVFFAGAGATFGANWLGHFPWFYTNNILNDMLPKYSDDKLKKLSRNAGIGFASSITSDCVSNSVRVLKTVKQSSAVHITYLDATKQIVAQDGVIGFMTRGLKTRIITNGLQGAMFSVVWRYMDEYLKKYL